MKLEKFFIHQDIDHVKAVGKGKAVNLPPENLPEVAFIGRSNVGKSTLINALVGRKKLAVTSKTPGATRGIHFFHLGESLSLVDLPGYGYANLSKEIAGKLSARVEFYLHSRKALKCVYVLVDGRHGFKSSDFEMMCTLALAGVRSQIILTKMAKASAEAMEQCNLVAEMSEVLGQHAPVLATDAPSGLGLNGVREHVLMVSGIHI